MPEDGPAGRRPIARFDRIMPDRLRPAPEPQAIALKALALRRRQLAELVAMEKARLRKAFEAEIAASHRAVIAALEAACAAVEHRLEALIAADPALARRRDILVSVPGIGARIAGVVIADMPELGTIEPKAAASLAGMAPHPSRSGPSAGGNAISGGRPSLGPPSTWPACSPPQPPAVPGAVPGHARGRKAAQGRHRRRRPAPRHHRQRPHPRRQDLRRRQARLTANTAAIPLPPPPLR